MLLLNYVKLLKKLVQYNKAGSVALRYQTNVTIMPPSEASRLWANFKKIKFCLSVDDIGPRLEYQRHPAKWKVIDKNIKEYLNFPISINKIFIKMDTTISIFNVYYIPELVEYIEKINRMDNKHKLNFTPHLFKGPRSFNIQSLHPRKKDTIKAKLDNYLDSKGNTLPGYIAEYIKMINQYMMHKSLWNEDKDKLRTREIKRSDKFRHESFERTFPEMYKILYSK